MNLQVFSCMPLSHCHLGFEMHPSQLEIAVWRSSAGRCDKSPQRGIAVLCTDFCIFSHFFSLILPISTGPRLGNSPVQSIVQCLARKDGTDDFYQLKVSTFLGLVYMVLTSWGSTSGQARQITIYFWLQIHVVWLFVIELCRGVENDTITKLWSWFSY